MSVILSAALAGGYSTEYSVLKLIGLIILCIVIIAASFFTTRLIGRRQMGAYSGSNFESIDVFRISQNKYLQLVKMGEKYVVLAVCKDSITKIAELSPEEVKIKEHTTPAMHFSDILDKFKNKTK